MREQEPVAGAAARAGARPGRRSVVAGRPSGGGARPARSAARIPRPPGRPACRTADRWSRRAWTRLCTEPGTRSLGRTLGVAQQLLEEQGIAGGALDAPPGEVAVRLEVSLGERARPRPGAAARGRWSRADCRRCSPRQAWSSGSPSMREVMTSIARHAAAVRGKAARWSRVARSAQWTSSTASRRGARALACAHQRGHRLAHAAAARRAVHRVVERTQLGRLRQIEQVVQEHPTVGERRVGATARSSALWRRPGRCRRAARAGCAPAPGSRPARSPCRSRAPARCDTRNHAPRPGAGTPRAGGSCRCLPRRADRLPAPSRRRGSRAACLRTARARCARPTNTPAARRRLIAHLEQAPGGDRRRQALELERADLAAGEALRQQAMHRVRDQDLAARGLIGEARGEVHRVAGDAVGAGGRRRRSPRPGRWRCRCAR